MHDEQVTLRVPGELSRRLREQARARGVPASQIVREALEGYLAMPPDDAVDTWARVAPLVGSLSIESAEVERDALSAQLRAHNWRE